MSRETSKITASRTAEAVATDHGNSFHRAVARRKTHTAARALNGHLALRAAAL